MQIRLFFVVLALLVPAFALAQEQEFQPAIVEAEVINQTVEANRLWEQVSRIQPARLQWYHGQDSIQKWAITVKSELNLDQLPGIPGATIQVEAPPNGGTDRRVDFFTRTLRGIYVVRGVGYSGESFQLAAFSFRGGSTGDGIGHILLQNGDPQRMFPAFSGFQLIEVFHQDGGMIARTAAVVIPWAPTEQGGPEFEVVGESVTAGRLAFIVSGKDLGVDTLVSAGRGGHFAEFRPSLGGSGGTAILPPNQDPGRGPTTITICSRGRCGTTIFQHKFVVPIQPPKG